MIRRDDTQFRKLIAPHLSAAYNLARWLTGNDADAADVLQDSSLRAFRYLASLQSDDARAWFFQIVRNTAYTALKRRKVTFELDSDDEVVDERPTADAMLVINADSDILRQALSQLSVADREILLLREFEELKYEEVAEVLQLPLGTVMSRLARARTRLKRAILDREGGI